MAASSNPANCTHPNAAWVTREGGWPARVIEHNDQGLDPTAGTAVTKVKNCPDCKWDLDRKLEYTYT